MHMHILLFAFSDFSFVAFSFSTFDTVGWVFWPVKTVSHAVISVYCVGGDVKHYSIQSNLW